MIKSILQNLETLRRNDPGLGLVFASQHGYHLGPMLAEAEIGEFEAAHGIVLPGAYRQFLLEAGNGGLGDADGAGPYCGIAGLGRGIRYLPDIHLHMDRACRLNPECSETEWYEQARFFEEDPYGTDAFWETYHGLFDGLLPLGMEAERGTYVMMLVLNGPHAGRVVVMDLELQKPFFHRDGDFLQWYARWTIECLAGYDMTRFGYAVFGDSVSLLAQAAESNDPDLQKRTLEGLMNLERLSADELGLLLRFCEHPDVRVRHAAIQALFHFDADAGKAAVAGLWGLADADRSFAIRLIQKQGKPFFKDWSAVILANLDRIQDHQVFRLSLSLLNGAGVDFGSALLPFLSHGNEEIQMAAVDFLGMLPNKAQYLEEFKVALGSNSFKVVCTALYSLRGLEDDGLLPIYALLAENFPGNSYLLQDLLDRLEDMGETGHFLVEKLVDHRDSAIAKRAQQILGR